MNYRTLVFVYRTDANPASLAAEFVRELRGDGSYECSLCHLTYSKVRKKPEWTRFTKNLALNSKFRLRSLFLRDHPEFDDRDFPAVFIEDASGGLHDFLDADALRACQTVVELIDVVGHRLDDVLKQQQPSES